jgi:hypothetical protein
VGLLEVGAFHTNIHFLAAVKVSSVPSHFYSHKILGYLMVSHRRFCITEGKINLIEKYVKPECRHLFLVQLNKSHLLHSHVTSTCK